MFKSLSAWVLNKKKSLSAWVLNKNLGEYVEKLSSKAISVSIWRGDIKVDNLMLKKEICAKFKLPFEFEIVSVRVGTLHIKVPWRHLRS